MVAAAAIHLTLAALFAPHIQLEAHLPPALDRVIAYYGAFSGVHTHFDFFAPGVATQARLEFRVHAADGSVRVARLATADREANNRIATMLTDFGFASERDALLRSWGRYALRLYPDAVAVEPRLEVLALPSLSDAAAGERPRWVELARTHMRRGDAGAH